MPPGLSLGSIVEEPKPVKEPGVQELTRSELEKGMDLIQSLLDERMDDGEKRQMAEELASEARVPWRTKRSNSPGLRLPRRHKNKFSFAWCDCCDGNSCPEEKSGF